MKHYRLTLAFLLLWLFSGLAFAQIDTDGDGLDDSVDNCPTVPGPRTNMGCPIPVPDRDGDGVPDASDSCPNDFGTANGCPVDTDNDGWLDHADACPTVPGSNGGCPGGETPVPDSDGDGVPDTQDACPTQAARTPNGCPAYTPAVPPADGKCYATPATASNVNIRVMPGVNEGIVAVLTPPNQAEVLAKIKDTLNQTWYNVIDKDGIAGFVASGVVVVQGTCGFLADTTAVATPVPTSAPAFACTMTPYPNTTLNMFSLPQVGQGIVGKVVYPQQAEVFAQVSDANNQIWHNVQNSDGIAGFVVNTDGFTLEGKCDLLANQPARTPPAPPQDGKCYATPTGDKANVRELPGVNEGIVAVLEAPEQALVYAFVKDSNNQAWYNVEDSDGIAGFAIGYDLAIQGACDFLAEMYANMPQPKPKAFTFEGVDGYGFEGYEALPLPDEDGERSLLLLPNAPDKPALVLVARPKKGLIVRLPDNGAFNFGRWLDNDEPEDTPPPGVPVIDFVPSFVFGDGSVKPLLGALPEEVEDAVGVQVGLELLPTPDGIPSPIGSFELKPADDEIAFAFGVGFGALEAEFSIESIASLLANPFAPPAPTPTPAPVEAQCKHMSTGFYASKNSLSGVGYGLKVSDFTNIFVGLPGGANPNKHVLIKGISIQGKVRFFATGHNATYSASAMSVYGYLTAIGYPGAGGKKFQKSSSRFVSVVDESSQLADVIVELEYTISGDVTGKPYVDLSCGGV
jgi:hypothetical protein